jgi:AbrB family looped-hinge helix DNA binding protein
MVKAAVLGTSRITSQGQITIPKEVRQKLRLKSGDFVQYLLTVDGHVLIRKFEFDIDLMVRDVEKLIKSKEFKLS